MKKSFITKRSGFTLVEMLIVVGVLAMLLGLLAPAILKNIKIAEKKKRINERAVLQAGIVEFWHDQNKWPIKSGDTPKKFSDVLSNSNTNTPSNIPGIVPSPPAVETPPIVADAMASSS